MKQSTSLWTTALFPGTGTFVITHEGTKLFQIVPDGIIPFDKRRKVGIPISLAELNTLAHSVK